MGSYSHRTCLDRVKFLSLLDNGIKDFPSCSITMEVDETGCTLENECEQMSPKSAISRLSEPVRKSKKRRTINAVEFTIPKAHEFTLLATCNYRVNQLKAMCRHYKLKVGGNKDELTARVYNYLRLSSSAMVIQARWRQILTMKYISARGPAYYKRDLCVNDTDFYTTQEVSEIPNEQFISYRCSDGFVYGFDIMSLYTWISKGIRGQVQNPYNRSILPQSVYDAIAHIRKMARSRGENVVVATVAEEIDPTKQLQLRGLSLFQHIQEVTSYVVDHLWWWELGRISLIRFIRELCDIWEYRAQLDPIVKREICPPHGNAFNRNEVHGLQLMSMDQLRRASLMIIERMVRLAAATENQALGSSYVLCALTLVSAQAANQFPWLYQSVAYQA